MSKPEDLSAEERLLQVIQNGGESPLPKKKSFFGEIHKKIRLMFHRGEAPYKPKLDRVSVMARLNKALILCGALVLILSVVNVFFFRPDIGLLHSRVAEALPIQEHPNLRPPPVDEYLAALTTRSLFQAVAGELAPPKKPSPTDEAITGVLNDLKLVGIAWGAAPEAMIREVKEGRTFFLKEGEKIRGVTVKEILKDRVILEYNGQTKEFM